MKLALKNDHFKTKYLVLDVNAKSTDEVLKHLKDQLQSSKAVNVSTLVSALLNKFPVNGMTVDTKYDVRLDMPYKWNFDDLLFHDFAGGKTSDKLKNYQGECCKTGDIIRFNYNGGTKHDYRLVKVKSIDGTYITGDDLEKQEFRKYLRSSILGKIEVMKKA